MIAFPTQTPKGLFSHIPVLVSQEGLVEHSSSLSTRATGLCKLYVARADSVTAVLGNSLLLECQLGPVLIRKKLH